MAEVVKLKPRPTTATLDDLKLLAELMGTRKPQHKQSALRLGRHFPTTEALEADGRELLLNQQNEPLWQRWPDGKIDVVDPLQRQDFVSTRSLFDANKRHHYQDYRGMKVLRGVLARWQVVRHAKGDIDLMPLATLPLLELEIPDDDNVGGVFAAISKNILNYPLARDARSNEWRFRRGKKTRRWIGTLPVKDEREYDDRVSYSFDPEVERELVHCPTGFDINVLFLVIAQAQKRNTSVVTFASRTDMLRELGYDCGQRNRDRLTQSLIYWCEANITFGRWYLTEKERSKPDERHAVEKLDAPLSGFELDQRKVKLTLRLRWRKLHYFMKVPLPLPRDAVTQNLVLAVLASPTDKQGKTDPRRVRRFCRKLGINHARRNVVLKRALDDAVAWFAEHGGSLAYEFTDDGLVFTMQRPRKRPVLATPDVCDDVSEPEQAPVTPRRRLIRPRALTAPSDAVLLPEYSA